MGDCPLASRRNIRSCVESCASDRVNTWLVDGRHSRLANPRAWKILAVMDADLQHPPECCSETLPRDAARERILASRAVTSKVVASATRPSAAGSFRAAHNLIGFACCPK